MNAGFRVAIAIAIAAASVPAGIASLGGEQ